MTKSNHVTSDVLIIGGGAAGIIAARAAADSGVKVTLVEKNPRLGMKILISGGGKCNLTHSGSMEDIRRKFRHPEALFLKPSFYRFTNTHFLEILHDRGMRTYTRPDGRIFPVEPANAKDVVNYLTQYVAESGATVAFDTPVTGLDIVTVDGRPVIRGAFSDDQRFSAKTVIISTGGSSYPATGTTGDGWRWLRDAGHTIVPLRAALAPIYLEDVHTEWSGIALRDIVVKARSGEGKELSRWTGDLLFTHKGISGPCALAISRDITDYIDTPGKTASVEVDLAPALSFEDLQERIRKEIRVSPRKAALSLVDPFVPTRLVEPLAASAGCDPDLRLTNLPAKTMNKIVATLKGWNIGRVRAIPIERGEVVAGGVALGEVDPRTMASTVVDGLFLCGEVLDIAGPVGGYNLQAAWSTGFVAGESAAKLVRDRLDSDRLARP